MIACNGCGDSIEITSVPDVAVCGGTEESCTVATNGKDPTVVGVPEITPVDLSNPSPGGKVPEVMLHVYWVTPPFAARLAE